MSNNLSYTWLMKTSITFYAFISSSFCVSRMLKVAFLKTLFLIRRNFYARNFLLIFAAYDKKEIFKRIRGLFEQKKKPFTRVEKLNFSVLETFSKLGWKSWLLEDRFRYYGLRWNQVNSQYMLFNSMPPYWIFSTCLLRGLHLRMPRFPFHYIRLFYSRFIP